MNIPQQLARVMSDKGERYVAIATGVTVERLRRVVFGQEPPTRSILRYLSLLGFREPVIESGEFVLSSTLGIREKKLKAGILAVAELISNSRGVCGLHLNGEEASWDALRRGGMLEDWLREFDEALDLCNEDDC
jgi:hypothetical protein